MSAKQPARRVVWRLAGLAFPAALLLVLTPALHHVVDSTSTERLLAAPGQNAGSAEMATQETQPSFTLRTERNLVLVRVVVRDSRGEVVGNLRKEDFRLFDNGKPQTISQFAVEGSSAKPGAAKAPPSGAMAPSEPGVPATAAAAQRFVALYYDDVHTRFEDIALTRKATEHFLASSLQPGDRVAVFTSSGQVVQDFTADRDKLQQALARLLPRPVVPQETDPCPDISPYQAHLIVDQNDQFALQAGAQSVVECECGGNADPRRCPDPQGRAQAAAMRIMQQDETQSQYSLRALEAMIRRMALSPGQRTIVMISPGFYSQSLQFQISELIDRALRGGVVINALDSQGLVALVPGGDASRRGTVIPLAGLRIQYDSQELQANSDVMAELAADTGGIFFHNSNDYDGGLRKVAAGPGVYYVLAFSPLNLKFDGRFHKLKVELASSRGLTLQARRGYYAPRKGLDPKEQADEDIKEAMFSRDELRELPVDVHTQFFKVSEAQAELSVLAHLDLHAIRFRKEAQRNLEDLRFISSLFDQDGNYIDGQEKHLTLRLRDATLETLLRSGITVKTSFKVKPGLYTVREVVRDAEEGHLAGLSNAVEIPF